jgi:REP element-mobilizing transposase RayT
MIRGMEGTPIFRQDFDRQDFLDRLETLVGATGTRILAWVLMDNHVHLLIFSGPKGISQFMRRLLTGYAIHYNRRYSRKGHLFQDRYKSIVCDKDSYLLELVRYLHLNPLRAGRVKDLGELNRYKWCGHSALVGKSPIRWQEKDYVLKHFGENTRKAIRNYQRYMAEAKIQERRPDLVGGGLVRSLGGWSRVVTLRDKGEELEHDSRILGDGEFVAQILAEAEKGLRRQIHVKEKRDIITRVVSSYSAKEDISENEIVRGGQRWRTARARARIAFQLSRDWGISLAETARHLGVSTSAIANAIRKLEEEKK